MTTYFATCGRGLEPYLAAELAALGAAGIEPGRGGVNFAGDAATVYKANLWLRTAVRVLRPVLGADVRDPDELYEAVRTVDWAEFLTPDRTLAVDCNVRDSGITHSQYAARRVKDAICDQFRDAVDRRPSVDTDTPSVGLNLHISRDRATLSLDSSWQSLHKRGYRPVQSPAPLNEALAAGLLMHAGYDGSEPLIDPLCGSGTLVIEAAWIATRRPPGLTRKWFGFFGWADFDKALWAALKDDARRGMLPTAPHVLAGSDVHPGAVALAQKNAAGAGVGHVVKFLRQLLADARPPDGPPGLIICNPPYGERLGEEEQLVPLYRDIGETVFHHWPGWRTAVFTANPRLAKQIRLPGRTSAEFYNGGLPCRLWQFAPPNRRE